MSQEINKVAVIGAGQAGRRFALRCAQAGLDVILEDVMPANLRRAEAEFADLFVALTSGSMNFARTVEDAVREADIAIDFVPDELESKLEIFCLIDRMAPPKTILCTPSDLLSITDLASCTYRPDRCLAVRGDLAAGTAIHLLCPESASAEAISATRGLFVSLAFLPVIVNDPDLPTLTKNAKSLEPPAPPSS